MSVSIGSLLRKVVRIHPDEDRPFLFLSTHAFFNGLGVALAFAAINIIVIKKQSIEILPWLYMASSILMIVGGVFYNKLEHAFPPKRVFIFSLVFCVTWAFVMRFLLKPDNSLFFIGLAYSSYYLILVLTNLDLWGSAALVFNVRQSKRLFGPLSFSESIGGIIGYSMSPLIVNYLAVQDMMILSGVSFLVSAVVLYNMRNRYLQADHRHDSHDHKHDLHETVHHDDTGFWARLFHNNKYIEQLSILILLSTIVYYIITYGFLSRVEVQFKSLTDIAWFIGVFLSFVKIMNLLIKVLFSSHVFSKLGIKFGLTLLPIIIITISGIGLILLVNGVDNQFFFIYLFSALYFFDKLFRSSLSKPSYLIMFQPMSPSLRLSGHTITKGYFEPLAMGLAGGLILLLGFFGIFSFQSLLIIILTGSILWFVSCRVGINQYLVELQAALKNRLFGSSSYRLSKQEITLVTDLKLESDNELDRLYALSLLHGKIAQAKEIATYNSLLSSTNDSIVKTSLEAIENNKLRASRDQLINLLTNSNSTIRTQAAYSLAAVYDQEAIEILTKHIEEDAEKNNSFIGPLIKYTGIHGTLAVGNKLLKLTKSPVVADRILAADIIGKTKNIEYEGLLMQFLKDEDDRVKAAGIRACSATSNEPLLKRVLSLLKDRKFLSPIKACVETNPQLSHQEISARYPTASRGIQRRLVEVSGKINSSENNRFLLNLLNPQEKHVHTEVIRNLYNQHFNPENSKEKSIVDNTIDSYLTELTLLVDLHDKMDKRLILKSGIKSEIESIGIVNVLRLLSFIFNKKTVDKIIRNITIGENDGSLANAIELLENLLPNKWSRKFVHIIESIYERNNDAHHHDKEKILDMMSLIKTGKLQVSDYLFGLMIRTFDIFRLPLDEEFINLARSKKSPIIAGELSRFTN